MLGLGVAVLAIVIIVLFARNWGIDTGPGRMVKIKIFITHVQVGVTSLRYMLLLSLLIACICWIRSARCIA